MRKAYATFRPNGQQSTYQDSSGLV
ncbi:protein of unknown function [Cupriavidus taiwanensis]|uniref:Uncharacterized protein n=1 Tax=Cupriavidus taiwanensis TaxID=164546 RepID=A0A375IGW0_9BURK|nr:protein of unknown function [Cupriavidus taiwanensis]